MAKVSQRKLKAPQYQRGKFQKRIKHPGPALKSGWLIFRQSLRVLVSNKRLFGGILAVYALLSLILVKGLGTTAELSDIKTVLEQANDGAISTGGTLLSSLFASSGAATPEGATYQSVLFIVASLAVIWALRQVYNPKKSAAITSKQAFYKGMGPLVPFSLVLVVITIQLIPMLVGSTVYSLITTNGLAVNAAEQIGWLGLLFVLSLWTFYMLTASVFAVYIVTLPDVTPIQALKSAKKLVKFRRWTVMRKLLFLPLILLVLMCVVMLPVVLFLTPVAEWIFFVFGLAMLIVAHSYLYNLYRELM